MFKRTPAGVCLSLEEFNRIQRAAGLPERVAVKTAKSNKKAQNANRAAHAAKQREIRDLRNSGRKAK
jgi:hypothetical protein